MGNPVMALGRDAPVEADEAYVTDRGALVWRTQKRCVLLPSSRVFHWLKRGFETRYLRQYR